MTPARVAFDDCEYSDSQELLFAGEPYTGTVFEAAPDGRLVSEQAYTRGLRDGLSRVWFSSGTLSRETLFVRGRQRRLQRWHRNGQLQYDVAYDEQGRVVSELAWNEQGEPVPPA